MTKQKTYAKQYYFKRHYEEKGLGWGRENGENQGKSMEEEKNKIWNEVWSGFNLCQLANKSMKAVLGMDIPSVT